MAARAEETVAQAELARLQLSLRAQAATEFANDRLAFSAGLQALLAGEGLDTPAGEGQGVEITARNGRE